MGIVVSYKVKVRLILGFGHRCDVTSQLLYFLGIILLMLISSCFVSDVTLELPFTMTHPKPVESPSNSRPGSALPGESGDGLGVHGAADTDLIQLNPKYELPTIMTREINELVDDAVGCDVAGATTTSSSRTSRVCVSRATKATRRMRELASPDPP